MEKIYKLITTEETLKILCMINFFFIMFQILDNLALNRRMMAVIKAMNTSLWK